jgi:3-dehydroquinate dehydratase type II
MRSVLVINGPNLNLLGTREPAVYGTTTLRDLESLVKAWGESLGLAVDTFQSNHEGAIIDRIHEGGSDGVILNAGAYTHYSYAIHDAIAAAGAPTVEVHISNIRAREDWRRRSVVAPACVATIFGRGTEGYRWALRHLVARAAWTVDTLSFGDGPERIGDLRLPEGSGPHPVVALIHGGFWRDQWTRDTLDGIAVDLATRGYATWNFEYRRVGDGGGWPSTADDVAAGLDVLADLADTYPLDPARVAVTGHSAGGQLALWAAARHRFPSVRRGAMPRIRPAAALLLAPITDLIEAHWQGVGNGAVEAFLRRTPTDGMDRYQEASPLELLPIGVPQVVVHGSADDQVPAEMSRRYAGAADDEVDFLELPGTGHFEVIDPRHPAWQQAAAALQSLMPGGAEAV